MNQKGTALSGAAVTTEVLDSSSHILVKGQYGSGHKGLQQFFSPPELAALAHAVIGDNLPVLDPTAGDGSLLSAFTPDLCYGVEIDQDQIDLSDGRYHAIQGDIKAVCPLIERACPSWKAIVANPPFGLRDWSDPTIRNGARVGSAALTFLYVNRLLADDGQFVFVCGRDQFDREIAQLPEARGIYFVLEVEHLFEGTQHPCIVAFSVHPEAGDNGAPERVTLPNVSLLGMAAASVIAKRNTLRLYPYPATYFYRPERVADAWKACADEHRRRRARIDLGVAAREYDIELVGGAILNVHPSPFARIALAEAGTLKQIQGIHNKSINYFASYERDWIVVQEAVEAGILSVQPRVFAAVEAIIHDSRRSTTPRYPIKEAQRLGFLTDVNNIRCRLDDPERGFTAGESYPITCRTVSTESSFSKWEMAKRGDKMGELVERHYTQYRKALEIRIGKHCFRDGAENQDDIAYLVEHFEMPDPGDVATRYPEEVEANRALIRQIEEDTIIPCSTKYAKTHPNKPPLKLRGFQVEDLARLLIDNSGLLAWEQGLGKTLAGLTFIEAAFRRGAQRCALIIAPQDLLGQWADEAERAFGIKPTVIRTHAQAKQIATRMRHGKSGIYITYYEALAVNGTSRSEMLEEIIVESRTEYVQIPGTGVWGEMVFAIRDGSGGWVERDTDEPMTDEEREIYCKIPLSLLDAPARFPIRGFIPPRYEDRVKHITSKTLCPNCKADRSQGWNGKSCRAERREGGICGYSHYKHRVKPMGSLLTTAFRKGVILVDELTMIQGDYSERSRVVRGLRARYRLGMTGTPVKNYIPQAFWLLWWCLGNRSKRFPYNYDGKNDFEQNHAVIQHLMVGGKKSARKVLPEVTNLSQLWRLLAASIIRRRKEETAEPIVNAFIHPISVPLGTAQLQQMETWRKDFHLFFTEMNPDHPVTRAGMAEVMAPMLGLGMKLDYAATAPLGDPDHSWTQIEDVSNFTPANLRTLEITMALVQQGRKVLVGSQWIPEAAWLNERLLEKGVRSTSLLDANDTTLPPKKRAGIIRAFQEGDVQVLCAGIQSIRLGHNLDAATAAVINGLPWDYESFDQFIARIHRLTSTLDIDVYVILPGSKLADGQPTITARKWQMLRMKGQAANLALDGRLIEKDEKPISQEDVIAELLEKGIQAAGDEIPEGQIEDLWSRLMHVDLFVPAPQLLQPDDNPEDALVLAATHVPPPSPVPPPPCVVAHPPPPSPLTPLAFIDPYALAAALSAPTTPRPAVSPIPTLTVSDTPEDESDALDPPHPTADPAQISLLDDILDTHWYTEVF